MNQIRTYSKSRPKLSVTLHEKEDKIFESYSQKSKINCDYTDEESDQEDVIHQENRKYTVAGRKMRPVTGSKSKQGKLKSLKKPVNNKTTTSKRKTTALEPTPIKRAAKFQKTKKQNGKKRTKFSWSGSDHSEDSSVPSIEILRKDEGMTWQQKISFLLPKMHQEYTKDGPVPGKTPEAKVSTPLLNISAEEIKEVEEEDDDYTYTWVTESGTKTKNNGPSTYTWVTDTASKTNVGQSTVPSTCTRMIGDSSCHDTTVRASNKSSSLKRIGDSVNTSRTGKLKLPVSKASMSAIIHEPSVNEFLDKDKEINSFNQKWNSTIQKDAKNILECGFPADMSSIRLLNSGSKKAKLQRKLETTPKKEISFRAPSRPRKKKITQTQLNSTKMFLSDHIAFVDMVPEMSTINRVSGNLNDSIELTREKSPFVRLCKAESLMTPFISPKKVENEQVFTSTPTKDKDQKGKGLLEFDLSSVQIPEFDDDELEIHESREVNSQEIVCEPTEEELDVPDHIDVIEKAPSDQEMLKRKKDKLYSEDGACHGLQSHVETNNFTVKPGENESNETSKNVDPTQVENITVIPITRAYKPASMVKLNETKNSDLEECCIAALRVSVKPVRKSNTCIDYNNILMTTPIDCIQEIF